MIKNLIANLPIYIAQVIGLLVSTVSYVGTLFLAIGIETHKAFKTPTGLKLMEVELAAKKVTDYLEKQKNKVPAPTTSSSQESKRLLNIVKESKPE